MLRVLVSFYRYGLIEAGDNDTSHTLNNIPEPLDSTRSSGHSSRLVLTLRGPLGRRFFYGAEASWLGLALNDDLTRSIAVDSHQRDRAQRTSAALGFGYFLNQRTVLSADFAGGTSPANTGRTETGTVRCSRPATRTAASSRRTWVLRPSCLHACL